MKNMSKNNSLDDTNTWRMGGKKIQQGNLRRNRGKKEEKKVKKRRVVNTIKYKEVRCDKDLAKFIDSILHVLIT